jgi:hypothetical protein
MEATVNEPTTFQPSERVIERAPIPMPVHPPVPIKQPSRVKPFLKVPIHAFENTSPAARTVQYFTGVDYGVGVNTPSASAANVAVTGTPTLIPMADGETVSYTMTEISTEEDLQTALGLSVEANGGIGLFSASARMDYAKSCAMNSSSVFLLVSIQVTEAFNMIKQPGIDPAAAALLASGNNTRFQAQYGDMFVRGLQTGGAFFGMIEIKTKDETDKETLSASVSAAYGPFGGSGQFSQSFTDAVKTRSLRIICHIEGGTVPNPLPTSLDMLINTMGTWAATVKGHAVPYSVLLDSYAILPLPNPPNFIDLQHQVDVLNQCAQWRNEDLQALNDLAYIKTNPLQFTKVNLTQINQWQNEVSADLNTIATAASNALNNPATASLPQLRLPPPLPLPMRITTSFVTIPQWGYLEDLTTHAVDSHGNVLYPTARDLGLNYKVVMLPNTNPNAEYDIARTDPAEGTMIPVDTLVTVYVYDRAPNESRC